MLERTPTGIPNRPWMAGAQLLLALGVVAATSHGVWLRFGELGLSEHPFRNRAVFLAVWFLSGAVMASVTLLPSFRARACYACPLALATFAGQAFVQVTGHPLGYGELSSMWIARADARSALYSYWVQALPALGMTLTFALALTMPSCVSLGRRWSRRLVHVGYLLPVALVAGLIGMKGGAAALGLPEPVKVGAMFAYLMYSEATSDFDAGRRGVERGPSVDGPRPHLVLIVDESVRGDFLSINSPSAQTTPFLETLGDRLINFGVAASAFDCSHYSNAALRYGVRSGAPRDSLLTNPSIWEYAKTAGYETTYLDAQRRHGELQNLMSSRERRHIDHFVQYSDVDSVERSDEFVRKDHRAAADLREILRRKPPQFVLVNKEGVHSPYEGKYPEDEARFEPRMSIFEAVTAGTDRQRLVNSYRNAVSWAVDGFFRILVPHVPLTNSIIIYTSDHGQNLLDKGVPTHCAGPDPALGVVTVPLLAITQHEEWQSRLREAARRNRDRASHFNVFGLLVDAMGYQAQDLSIIYDPGLTDEIAARPVYFTGDLIQEEVRRHEYDAGRLFEAKPPPAVEQLVWNRAKPAPSPR